jgi:hypothetical protein
MAQEVCIQSGLSIWLIFKDKGMEQEKMIKQCRRFLMSWVLIGLAACTTMNVQVSQLVALPSSSRIMIGPIANNADTPLAHKQVETMSMGILHGKGFRQVSLVPNQGKCDALLYCPDAIMNKNQLISYAKRMGVQYVVTGAANEWRYKVGLDGEPVAGVSLSMIEVASGRTIWTGVGSVVGTPRLGLDVVAQDMLNKVFASIIAK